MPCTHLLAIHQRLTFTRCMQHRLVLHPFAPTHVHKRYKLKLQVAALKEKLLLSEEQMEKLAAAGYKKSYDSPRFKPLNSPKLDPIKEGQTVCLCALEL